MKPFRLFKTAASVRGLVALGTLADAIAPPAQRGGAAVNLAKRLAAKLAPKLNFRSAQTSAPKPFRAPTGRGCRVAVEQQRQSIGARRSLPTPRVSALSVGAELRCESAPVLSQLPLRRKWDPLPAFERPAPAIATGHFARPSVPELERRSMRAYIGGPDAGIAAVGFEAEDEARRLWLNQQVKSAPPRRGPAPSLATLERRRSFQPGATPRRLYRLPKGEVILER